MSQKVVIERVTVKGATPYLGDSSDGSPIFSRNGNDVMNWLCSAWRTRYNQLRSQRSRYDSNHNLVPLGKAVDTRTVKQVRQDCSWMTSVPSLVIESPSKIERTHWFAAAQRRKTLRSQGKHPGSMPRFRSRKRDDDVFTCWFNGGRNARFEMVNRNHGIVTITGKNPPAKRLTGDKSGFRIRLQVRVSEPIRDYTSVQVNWTKRTLVFTNTPTPVDRQPTGKLVGVDRGVVHQIATSEGEFVDLPRKRLRGLDREVRRRQKAQARSLKSSGHATQREYRKAGVSNRFADHDREIARLKGTARRVVLDVQHKVSRSLVENYDVIVLEDLNLAGMLRSPNVKPDLLNPGRFLPNGKAAKHGLNRALSTASMSRLGELVKYKAEACGVAVVTVDPKNTSRHCPRCGHTGKENRESQAVFSCTSCGFTANADSVAAVNIATRGVKALQGGAHPGVEVSKPELEFTENSVRLTCEARTSGR